MSEDLAEAVAVSDLARVTAAVREADRAFEQGGSSRHFVQDCLLPALEAERLVVVDALVPQHLKSAERDVASLCLKLDAAEQLLHGTLAACEAVDKMARFIWGNDLAMFPAQWRPEYTAVRAIIAKARAR